jgi:hypothetical protein
VRAVERSKTQTLTRMFDNFGCVSTIFKRKGVFRRWKPQNNCIKGKKMMSQQPEGKEVINTVNYQKTDVAKTEGASKFKRKN